MCTPMEHRIVTLYQLLGKYIMPWQWDYFNYSGDNADMVGFFYPEDLNAIRQIDSLISARNEREAAQKK